MINQLKRVAESLPLRWRQGIKRQYFAFKIRHHRFTSEEPEYQILDSLVASGDWVLDIGANIGTYTARLSELVGENGRVFAFEPIGNTFELLVANSRLFPFQNTTLLNVAISDQSQLVSMSIPTWQDGRSNYYEAFITDNCKGTNVYSTTIDSLSLPHKVRFAKIDTEGHELQVLHGMRRLIERDHPTLLVEVNSPSVKEFLSELGYDATSDERSANSLFQFHQRG